MVLEKKYQQNPMKNQTNGTELRTQKGNPHICEQLIYDKRAKSHADTPHNHLHESHTQGMDAAGTRALLKQVLLMCQQQLGPNYNRRVHTVPSPVHMDLPTLVTKEAAPLCPTGHLLHKATLPRPGDIAALPNT